MGTHLSYPDPKSVILAKNQSNFFGRELMINLARVYVYTTFPTATINLARVYVYTAFPTATLNLTSVYPRTSLSMIKKMGVASDAPFLEGESLLVSVRPFISLTPLVNVTLYVTVYVTLYVELYVTVYVTLYVMVYVTLYVTL